MTGAASLADRLFDAWRNQAPIVHETLPPGLKPFGAYSIQDELTAQFVAAGREPIGWKTGLTSSAAMQAFGAEEPMVGVIYRDSVVPDGGDIDLTRLIAPRVEGEILLEIGSIPTEGADDEALLASIANVRVAFEIADSRVEGWPRHVGGLIADNAACAKIVFQPDATVSPVDVDFMGCAMTMACDGEVVTTGSGADCMGSILEVYRWFVADSRRRGRTLRPGQLILCGAMGQPLAMESGRRYELTVSGVGKVSVSTSP